MKTKIPKFKSVREERSFWAKRDSSDFVDWSKARRAKFPDLKPSTRTISLRLPQMLIDELKILAHKRDIPYQSLLKSFLSERVREELSPKAGQTTKL
jgi:predicted DNA binding CopG/RHH family protein